MTEGTPQGRTDRLNRALRAVSELAQTTCDNQHAHSAYQLGYLVSWLSLMHPEIAESTAASFEDQVDSELGVTPPG
jgi:hypothetical protein